MSIITDIQINKPSVETIKYYYNKASAGISKQYKFFYFQCCVPNKNDDNFEPYDDMIWDYGFLNGDLYFKNTSIVEIADFIRYTDKQIQDILDELERNAIIEVKRIEAENKLKRISEDF